MKSTRPRHCPIRVSPSRSRRLLSAALLTGALGAPLTAQVYWDTNGATAGSGNAGGVWNSGSNWTSDSTGSSVTAAWADGQNAIFSAGTDGTGVLPVTIAGAVTAGEVRTEEGTVQISSGTLNSSTINILGTTTLEFSGSSVVTNSGTINVSQNSLGGGTNMATLTISGGAVTTGRIEIGNAGNGQGTVNLSGGSLTVTATDGLGGMRLGHWPGAAGTRIFNHTGGQLNFAGSTINIGWDGTGSRYQASGAAVMSGNAITVQRESTFLIQSGASVTATSLTAGTGRGAGHVVHEGGTLTVNGATLIQNQGSLTLRGNSITNTVGNLAIGGQEGGTASPLPTLYVQENAVLNAFNIGMGETGTDNRPGAMVQSGGTVNVSGTFRIGHWDNNSSSFSISGGTLNLTSTAGGEEGNGTLTVGVDGIGTATQTGGTINAERLHLNSRTALGTPGVNTFSLQGGVLSLRDQGITGNTVSSGGNTSTYALNLGGGTVRAAESFAIAIPATLTGINGNTTFDTNGNTITANGALSGPGGFVKTGAGALVLNGASTFSGGVDIQAGTVRTGNATALGNASSVNIQSGAFLDVSPNAPYQMSTAISGGGTVQGNTVLGTASVIRPGDAHGASQGALTFQNDLTLNGVFAAEFQLGSADANIGHLLPSTLSADPANSGSSDRLLVQGLLTLNGQGTLHALAGTGFDPMLGNIYDLADWASLVIDAGAELSYALPTLTGGLSWDTSRFADLGVLAIVPEPGRALLTAAGLLGATAIRRRRSR